MRVLAAMSGGVDSAVAAARAVEAGHDVVGVHLALSETPAALRGGSRGCCSREDAGDARRAADVLDIPFYVWDFAARFTADVVDDFVAAYAAGQTPNPCLRCNEKIKFAALLDRALGLGFDAVCTGHYARLAAGRRRRARAAPRRRRGQGPVLRAGRAHQRTSSRTRCSRSATPPRPTCAPRPPHAGCGWPTSPTATTSASSRPATPGRSSPSGSVRGPGPVVDDATGAELARHDGVHGFTVGQRKGLGVAAPAADGRPRYVLGIEPASGTVRVGPAGALDVRSIEAGPAGVERRPRAARDRFRCVAQVRAHGGLAAAHAPCPTGRTALRVELDEPLRGVAPGQTVALYRPDSGRGRRAGQRDHHRRELSSAWRSVAVRRPPCQESHVADVRRPERGFPDIRDGLAHRGAIGHALPRPEEVAAVAEAQDVSDRAEDVVQSAPLRALGRVGLVAYGVVNL